MRFWRRREGVIRDLNLKEMPWSAPLSSLASDVYVFSCSLLILTIQSSHSFVGAQVNHKGDLPQPLIPICFRASEYRQIHALCDIVSWMMTVLSSKASKEQNEWQREEGMANIRYPGRRLENSFLSRRRRSDGEDAFIRRRRHPPDFPQRSLSYFTLDYFPHSFPFFLLPMGPSSSICNGHSPANRLCGNEFFHSSQ